MKKNAFGYVMYGIALIFLLVTGVLSFRATGNTAEGYHRIQNAELSEGLKDSFYYDDKFYAVLGYGVDIDIQDPNKEGTRDAFLEESLRKIDGRILAADVLYAMLAETILAYPLYQRKRKGLLPIFLSVILIYLFLCGMNALFSLIHGIPFYLLDLQAFLCIAIGLLSVVAGTSVLLWILEKIRFRKLTAFLAIPLVFVLFIASLLLEAKLSMPRYIESFEYLSSRLTEDENAYYDEEKDVMVIDGKEYSAQIKENPEHLSGILRIPAYALEILDPYAGNSLEMLRQILEEDRLPVLSELCYVLKACGYIFLVYHMEKKEKQKINGTVSAE